MLSLDYLYIAEALESFEKSLLGQLQGGAYLVEAMHAVEILCEGLLFAIVFVIVQSVKRVLIPTAQPPRVKFQSPRNTLQRRHGILVHAVQEALDDAKGNESPDVHVRQRGAVLNSPRLDGHALPQARVQPYDGVPAQQRPRGGDVARALVLHARVGDHARDAGRGRVRGAKLEDVEEEQAAVVEEVADRAAGEGEVGVGGGGDAGDARDAVDVGRDARHGQVPCLVCEGGEADGGEGDVPGAHGGRGWVGGEEFEVERVGFVWEWGLGDGL